MFKLEKLEKVLGKETTDKLRLAFTGELPNDPGDEHPESTEQVFAALADGSGKISGSIAEGSSVAFVDAEGNESQAEGTYVLEGGKTITCEAGVITSVSAEEEAPAEEAMSEEKVLNAIQTALKVQSVELTNTLTSEFSAKIEAINVKHENDLKAITNKFSAVIEAMEAMATINSAAPSHREDPKQKFSEKRATAFSSLLKSIDTIKK